MPHMKKTTVNRAKRIAKKAVAKAKAAVKRAHHLSKKYHAQ